MESFLSTPAVTKKQQGRGMEELSPATLLQGREEAEPQLQIRTAAMRSTSMSKQVSPMTKMAYIVNAKALFASPSFNLPRSADKHASMLTSALSMAGTSRASTAGFAVRGRGPTGWYRGFWLMWRDRHGSRNPIPKRTANAKVRTKTTKATPCLPSKRNDSGGCTSSCTPTSSFTGAFGNGKPIEEIVAKMQKPQKAEKPTSKRASVKMSGRHCIPRTKCTNKM
mmetsp:Transcript_110920/g.236987  ORF Transcript_110920/g.236987 Transcript_110920/m.236987 type:complete len:224 (-) Transcript_110920:712-1383(-)